MGEVPDSLPLAHFDGGREAKKVDGIVGIVRGITRLNDVMLGRDLRAFQNLTELGARHDRVTAPLLLCRWMIACCRDRMW
jgi:hypothetical protein